MDIPLECLRQGIEFYLASFVSTYSSKLHRRLQRSDCESVGCGMWLDSSHVQHRLGRKMTMRKELGPDGQIVRRSMQVAKDQTVRKGFTWSR